MISKMTKRGITLSVMTLAIFLAVSAVSADSTGSMTFVSGQVDLLKAGTDSAFPADAGAIVGLQDIIRTKSNSRVEITLSDNTRIRLAENSRIQIAGVEVDESGSVMTRTFRLMRGRLRVVSPSGHDIRILTPNAEGTASGTEFYFIYEKGSSWFYGTGGSVSAWSSSQPEQFASVGPRNCIKIALHMAPDNECAFNDIDTEKFSWDTAAREDVPVVAQLPAEGAVYTYTPLGGRAIDTPSQPVLIASDDLTCSQCPPLAIPLIETPVPASASVKLGNFERIDNSGPVETSQGEF